MAASSPASLGHLTISLGAQAPVLDQLNNNNHLGGRFNNNSFNNNNSSHSHHNNNLLPVLQSNKDPSSPPTPGQPPSPLPQCSDPNPSA